MINPQKKDDAVESAANAADPFADLSKLRLSQSFIELAGAKKLLTTVPVRKPNPQDFVRVHPGEDYRMEFAFIELKDDRELYLLSPEIAAAVRAPNSVVSRRSAGRCRRTCSTCSSSFGIL